MGNFIFFSTVFCQNPQKRIFFSNYFSILTMTKARKSSLIYQFICPTIAIHFVLIHLVHKKAMRKLQAYVFKHAFADILSYQVTKIDASN